MTYLVSGIFLGFSAGISPGPMLALVISETLKYGTGEGMKVALAPLISDLPIVLGTILLLSRLADVDILVGTIALLGGLFLAFLGYESLTFTGADIETVQERPKSLQKAIVANLLNPHPYMFWLLIGAPLVLRASNIDASRVVFFICPFYIFLVGSKLAVAGIVGKSRRFLRARGYVYTIRLLGVAFLVLAVLFIVEGLKTMGVLNMKTSTGTADVNGTNLSYEVKGDGHPLVLIHGGLMDRRMWDDQREFFAHQYRVLRYDIRGYGTSAMPAGRFSHVEDLQGLLNSLDIDRAHILGLSLGGIIAIDFALEYPEMVSALIPVASGLNGYRYADAENLAGKYERIFKAVEEEGSGRAVDLLMELPFFIPADENSAMRRKMRTMAEENLTAWSAPESLYLWPEPPAIERLSEIDVPTLIIIGDQDVSDIFAVADTLGERIKGAKKIIIEGAGHHVNMEQPEAFNRAVLEFLRSVRQSLL